MSLNSDIINALSPIAPIDFHVYTGTSTTYMTFFTYNEHSGLIADDDEQSTVYSIQLDINSKGNIETLAEQAKTALKTLGFWRTSEMDLYNLDTKTYRRTISLTANKYK